MAKSKNLTVMIAYPAIGVALAGAFTTVLYKTNLFSGSSQSASTSPNSATPPSFSQSSEQNSRGADSNKNEGRSRTATAENIGASGEVTEDLVKTIRNGQLTIKNIDGRIKKLSEERTDLEKQRVEVGTDIRRKQSLLATLNTTLSENSRLPKDPAARERVFAVAQTVAQANATEDGRPFATVTVDQDHLAIEIAADVLYRNQTLKGQFRQSQIKRLEDLMNQVRETYKLERITVYTNPAVSATASDRERLVNLQGFLVEKYQDGTDLIEFRSGKPRGLASPQGNSNQSHRNAGSRISVELKLI